ncbi:unnamed protein product, partial [Dracunculus medinensis]
PKECPLGWTYLSNQCIKIYPQAFDADRASIICQNTGAILLTLNEDDEMFNEMFKDTVDLLNEHYEKGLHITTWLVQSDGESIKGISYDFFKNAYDTSSVRFMNLQRMPNGIYEMYAFKSIQLFLLPNKLKHFFLPSILDD